MVRGHQAIVDDIGEKLMYICKDGTNEHSGIYGKAKYTIY